MSNFSGNSSSVANQLIESTELPDIEDTELFENRLEDVLKKTSNVMNTKQSGLYTLKEVVTFQTVFTTSDPQKFRNVYRKCFDLVELNGADIGIGATVITPHGIDPLVDSMMIYVSCVSATPNAEYFTVVYPDVYLDSTNINFTNPHASALTSAIAICEYTKD